LNKFHLIVMLVIILTLQGCVPSPATPCPTLNFDIAVWMSDNTHLSYLGWDVADDNRTIYVADVATGENRGFVDIPRFPNDMHSVQWSLDSSRVLLYDFAADNDYTLFTVDREGTRAVLAEHLPQFVAYWWSPDEQQVAVLYVMEDRRTDLLLLNEDGRISWRLSDIDRGLQGPLLSHQLDWSPDGRQIAFTDGSGRGLAVISADGDNLHFVTPPYTGVQRVQWSPDGNLIAFNQDNAEDKLAVIKPDGSHPQGVVQDVFPENFAWLADSKGLVYTIQSGMIATLSIATVSVDGSTRSVLTTLDLPLGVEGFSPDGTMAAYFVDDDPSRRRELYVMNIDGTNVRQITNNQCGH
jgi:Tol biopolymer transport system component